MKRCITANFDPYLSVYYDDTISAIAKEDLKDLGLESSKYSTCTLEMKVMNANLHVEDGEYYVEDTNKQIEENAPLSDKYYISDDFFDYPVVDIDRALEDLWFYDDGIVSILPEIDGEYIVSFKGSMTYDCVINKYESDYVDIFVQSRPRFKFKDVSCVKKINQSKELSKIESGTIAKIESLEDLIHSEAIRAKDSVPDHYAICYAVIRQLRKNSSKVEYNVLLDSDNFIFVADSYEEYREKVENFCNGIDENNFEFYTVYNK